MYTHSEPLGRYICSWINGEEEGRRMFAPKIEEMVLICRDVLCNHEYFVSYHRVLGILPDLTPATHTTHTHSI
jgi:hypothetical protein